MHDKEVGELYNSCVDKKVSALNKKNEDNKKQTIDSVDNNLLTFYTEILSKKMNLITEKDKSIQTKQDENVFSLNSAIETMEYVIKLFEVKFSEIIK